MGVIKELNGEYFEDREDITAVKERELRKKLIETIMRYDKNKSVRELMYLDTKTLEGIYGNIMKKQNKNKKEDYPEDYLEDGIVYKDVLWDDEEKRGR